MHFLEQLLPIQTLALESQDMSRENADFDLCRWRAELKKTIVLVKSQAQD